ncbi:exported protein of unknown function [uncultured Sphingopyxis sp.]|uniref:Uncharacterized protein n=1 Tax=uncultured Sphingopyxis sp. TaxID=310581 RepID=A0A1Y5PWE3_9SPHN|nr:exported protein of unknown function [uncultured Sphingopyxis sp.]
MQADDKSQDMKRYRPLFLIVLIAALLFVGVAIAVLRADRCSDEGGVVIAFTTRNQHCADRN